MSTGSAKAAPAGHATSREEDERLRLAMQAGKIGIWDWDLRSDRISWSESLYEIYGIAPDRFDPTLGGFLSLVHPDDRQDLRRAIERVLDLDVPYEHEYRALRSDGRVVWLLTTAKVLREGGKAVRLLGATVDVTERKRVELALRESEQRFAKAFNASPLCLTISSLVSGKLLEVNETFVDITGYSREEALGRTTAELGVWARPRDREEELAAVEAAGKLRSREYVFRVRGGREITGLLSAETIDIGGEPCALTVIQDITERKKYEQALRDADRRKDEFLATLAHELRNPLAPIRNGIEVLKLAGSDPGRSQAVLAMMDRQLAQMVRLVDDLLDVSRISRGRIELRTEPVPLAAVVRSAIETSRPVIEQAGHRLAVELPDLEILVEADFTRLAQVLANLLNNAARYTPRGGTLRLSVEASDREATLRIADNGIGIPPAMLSQVFELFTQVDGSLEKSQSGLGIGLTIVKRLVEMHGGRVEARSEGAGKGSEFVVILPRLQGRGALASPAAAASRQSARRRILVVDDNRDSAESMAMMLEAQGHELELAHGGREALEVSERFRPDLVLLDIGMPDLNGYEVCRRIREREWSAGTTLVAMTGWGHDDDRRRSREAGFDQHLTKPVEPEALQRLLAELP